MDVVTHDSCQTGNKIFLANQIYFFIINMRIYVAKIN
jgi:hypothetical protein